ncbi:MAG: translation initiation inhibitor [Candidatus Sumerlaeota bacterium]|nr:translation initiation inhibitor [Candidatus Sumerlaeota bacterium]
MFRKIERITQEHGARIVSQEVFGLPNRDGEAPRALRDALGEPQWPVTWVNSITNPSPAGTLVWALTDTAVTPVMLDNRIVGSAWEDADCRWRRLGDLRPALAHASLARQASETFVSMEGALLASGMSFSNVARTWLYNDDILAWYKEFNLARDAFFRTRGVYDRMVPASTGIGGGNPFGTAIIAQALAVDFKTPQAKVFAVPSPLQCPALEYGSSFSRAVELDFPDHRRLLISGTASINPDGQTAYPEDMAGQVKLTMEVTGAILSSREMSWADVTRAIVYVARAGDEAVYYRYCASQGLKDIPEVVTYNDICRSDLLFEIEVDAIRVK